MRNIMALRREDMNKKGEKRAAVSPEVLAALSAGGVRFLVQPGSDPASGEVKRCFPDEIYRQAGAVLSEDISAAKVIFGLKEINQDQLLPEKAYFFFSHTHKGQPKNRAMLRKLAGLRCTVIDYELITAEDRQRLLTAFTYMAGYAGMTDSLWTLGRRLAIEGISHPLSRIPQAIEKEDLGEIRRLFIEAGEEIKEKGTPANLPPLITGFLGNGKTSTGAQALYDLLPVETIQIADLSEVFHHGSRHKVYKLVLDAMQMYRPRAEFRAELSQIDKKALFEAYLRQPEAFESNMDQVFPWCTLLMNCILWSPRFPRLLTREDTGKWFREAQTLRVIGDISCDPEGAIHFSKETWLDAPVYIYNPENEEITDGWEGSGIAVMAVTNLPCEFSSDASRQFSTELSPMLLAVADTDFDAESVAASGLPDALRRATLLWKGRFTPEYAYMEAFLSE